MSFKLLAGWRSHIQRHLNNQKMFKVTGTVAGGNGSASVLDKRRPKLLKSFQCTTVSLEFVDFNFDDCTCLQNAGYKYF